MVDTEIESEELAITSDDRCDYSECGAQAYVKIIGVSGELFFCAHHYNGIIDDAVGYDRVMQFSYKIIDQRNTLS